MPYQTGIIERVTDNKDDYDVNCDGWGFFVFKNLTSWVPLVGQKIIVEIDELDTVIMVARVEYRCLER